VHPSREKRESHWGESYKPLPSNDPPGFERSPGKRLAELFGSTLCLLNSNTLEPRLLKRRVWLCYLRQFRFSSSSHLTAAPPPSPRRCLLPDIRMPIRVSSRAAGVRRATLSSPARRKRRSDVPGRSRRRGRSRAPHSASALAFKPASERQ